MQTIKKHFFSLLVLFLIPTSIHAVSLTQKITVPDAYIISYVNFNKIQQSHFFNSLNQQIKSTVKNRTEIIGIYKRIIETIKKYNLKESDFSEFACSVGLKNNRIKSFDAVPPEDIKSVFAFSLNKQISFPTLEKITTELISGRKDLDAEIVLLNKHKFIKIVNNKDSLYLTTIPEDKLVLGGSKNSLLTVMNNIKTGNYSKPADELNSIKSDLSKNTAAYIAAAFPQSITKNITTSSSTLNNSGIKAIDANVFKKIYAVILQTNFADSLIINLNTFLTDKKSAQSLNLLLNQFIPLLKIQLFMSANGQPLPVLNKINTSIKNDKNIELNIDVSEQDISTLLKILNNKKD